MQHSNNSQLYLHDFAAQTNVDKCEGSDIMLGPNKSSVFLRDCKDCNFVVFCQQLRMRDCHNCRVMLYSQTEPVVEACTNIRFTTMTYWYEELLAQMQAADVSPWANKWQGVYDFTAHRQTEGVPNWSISQQLNWKMIPFLGEIHEKVSKVREFKGDRIKSVRDITESDLQCITLEFDEEYEIMSGLFDVGPYFNMYSQNIIKGVVPSAQFKNSQQNYRHTILLLAFVPDFAGIFDSTNAIADHEEEGAVDLKNTL